MQGFPSNFKPARSPPHRRALPSNSCHGRIDEFASTSAGCNNSQPYISRDVQRRILAHLPALKLMELEATCPSLWKPLLHCSTLKDRWKQLHQGAGRCDRETVVVWLMKSTSDDGQTLVAYIPAQRKYYLFLPLLFSLYVSPPSMNISVRKMKASLRNSRFVSASGPLIAFESSKRSLGLKLFVYNTLTGQKTSLPYLNLECCSLQSSLAPMLITENDHQSFCVIVPADAPRHNQQCVINTSIFVYDPAHHSIWIRYPMASAFVHAISYIDHNAVQSGDFFIYNCSNNDLYVWYRSLHSWGKLNVRYARVQFNSSESSADNMEGKVVKCGGHLLLVTSIVHNLEKGFIVWKLITGDDLMSWEWKQISTTPADLMWKSFSSLHPTYIIDDGHICMMPSASEYMPSLVYDVVHDKWFNLPGLLKNVHALCAIELSLTVAEHK